MSQQRPVAENVGRSPAAIDGLERSDTVSIDDAGDRSAAIRNAGDQPTEASGASSVIAPLPGLASFGDPDAGVCVDGVCAMPGDGK